MFLFAGELLDFKYFFSLKDLTMLGVRGAAWDAAWLMRVPTQRAGARVSVPAVLFLRVS